MAELWTDTIKYYRLAIKRFLPFIEELRDKTGVDGKDKNRLIDLIDVYIDVANKIDEQHLNLEDPNRFYDGEPHEVSLNLNEEMIEHFSRLTLRMLEEWQKRKKEIEEKSYQTDKNKDEYYSLKNLIWPLEAQFNNPSMLFSKHKIKGALKFPGEECIKNKKSKSSEKIQRAEIFRKFNFYNFHPLIIKVSYEQFEAGFYKEAIQNAFVEVINQVKDKSKHPKVNDIELDGDRLMNKVFGCQGQVPIIGFNSLSDSLDKAEQTGFMNLFKGIVGLRDKKAHINFIQDDPLKTIEYLALASLLIRLLDDHMG